MPSEWEIKDHDTQMQEGECQCCMLERLIQHKGKGDQPLCDACRVHIGSHNVERRERSHRLMWSEASKQFAQQHKDQLDAAMTERRNLNARISQLKEESATLRDALAQDYDQMIPEKVLNQFQMMKVNEANERVERAHGFISRLFRALLTVERGHHPLGDDATECACGLPINKCDAWEGLDTISDRLYAWENEERSRGRMNLRNELPSWHSDRY